MDVLIRIIEREFKIEGDNDLLVCVCPVGNVAPTINYANSVLNSNYAR